MLGARTAPATDAMRGGAASMPATKPVATVFCAADVDVAAGVAVDDTLVFVAVLMCAVAVGVRFTGVAVAVAVDVDVDVDVFVNVLVGVLVDGAPSDRNANSGYAESISPGTPWYVASDTSKPP